MSTKDRVPGFFVLIIIKTKDYHNKAESLTKEEKEKEEEIKELLKEEAQIRKLKLTAIPNLHKDLESINSCFGFLIFLIIVAILFFLPTLGRIDTSLHLIANRNCTL